LRSLLRSEFVRHGAWVFGAMMALNISNYAYHFFMTRWLGPDIYGALSSLLALTSLISIPAAIVTMIVVKYAAEFHAVGDLPKLRTLCERVLRASALFGAGVFALVLLAAPLLSRYIHVGDWGGTVVCGFIAAVGLVTPGTRGILQGMQDFRRLAFSIAIEGGGKCLFGVFLTYAGFGIRGALIGYAIGSAVSLIYSLAILKPFLLGERSPLRLDYPRLLRTMAAVGVVTVTLQVVTFADIVLVKHYFTPREAGLYSGVALTGKMMLFVVSFIPSIVLPKAAAAAARGEKARPLLVQAGALTTIICGAGLTAIFLMPGLALRLVAGKDYVVDAPYLFEYALAMALLAVSGIVANYQIAMHRYFFVVPTALVCLGEIGAVALFHRSIAQVVSLLAASNALLLLATLIRRYAPARTAAMSAGPWKFTGNVDVV
jgi:O-antigen/teichoic acid export membrane protein